MSLETMHIQRPTFESNGAKKQLSSSVSVTPLLANGHIDASTFLIGQDFSFTILETGEELGMWENFVDDANHESRSLSLDEFGFVTITRRSSSRKPFRISVLSASGASISVSLTRRQLRVICRYLEDRDSM